MKSLVPGEPVIDEIFETGRVVGRDGRSHALQDSITREEGWFLFSIIQSDPTITRTLEVGCGHGISSLHIAAGLRDRPGALHTIIDPWQSAPRSGGVDWAGVGAFNLDRQGHGNHRLIEVASEIALPRLLTEGDVDFDFVFIDGWHTFDHTLLDCFYATRLLRVGGGVLAIHDAWMPAVSRAVEFLRNYPCYEDYALPWGRVRTSTVGTGSMVNPFTKLEQARKLLRTLLGGDQDARRAARSTLVRRVRVGWPAGTFQSLAVLRKTEDDRRSAVWHVDFKARWPR